MKNSGATTANPALALDAARGLAILAMRPSGPMPFNPFGGIDLNGRPPAWAPVTRRDPKFYLGGIFAIVARHASRQNRRIQSAKSNGQPLTHPWITHGEIAHGGALKFETVIQPNKSWDTEN